ncbi:MAG: sugar ABC transporter permease [Chloroflexia bacterium]|nr:sugar ABC transporter permease [Chloroflexia bacterium]
MASDQQAAQITTAAEVEEQATSEHKKSFRDRGTLARQQERLGWILVVPVLVVIAIVAIYPLIETFRLSFTDTRLASIREPNYVGFANYRNTLDDPQFWSSMQNTAIFTVATVTLETLLGMIIALTIHSNFRGRGIVRTSMLVPWAIPTVVSSLLWEWMFHDRFGVINSILKQLNLMDESTFLAWAANPSTALGAVIAVDVWKTTPFMALLLLAGLQVIPTDVYEAAYVDGASKIQQFFHITLPLLKPALLVALIFRTLDAFRVFDMIFVLNGYALDTMSIAIYTQQQLIASQRIGEGSAPAVLIFLTIGTLAFIYTRLIKVEEG